MRLKQIIETKEQAMRVPRHRVTVFDKTGTILGHVTWQATSIAAAKIANGPVEWSRRFGQYAWVKKAA